MSLRNRARSLQKRTGLTYQQALQKLRALGDQPAKLSRQTGWDLEVCDRFLHDGHAPIDVIEVVQPPDPIVQVCESLRATSNARAVAVSAGNRILAHVGTADMVGPTGPGDMTTLWRAVEPPHKRPVTLPEVWELADGIVLYTARFKQGMVVVKFQREETSLGLVKLRTARAVEELERLLAGESKSPGVPPIGGRGGPGGLPAQVRVAAPKPPAPPKKKKKG